MKRFFVIVVVFTTAFFVTKNTSAATLADRLRGSILLQVESHGEAWYVEPVKSERWYLGRPADAFAVMRGLGLGITNVNLAKIPVAASTEAGDIVFTRRFLGRILLQVESHGEAWYVYPKDGRRYFLGRPDDAFQLMRELGFGITNRNLATLPIATASALPTLAVGTPTPALPDVGASVVPVPVVPPPSVLVPAPSLVTPSPVPPPIPSSSPIPSSVSSASPAQFQNDMLALVNTERQKSAASALTLNTAMNTAAQRFTDDMVARNYFAVKNPEGLGAKELLKQAGYEARAVGILLAGGPSDAAAAFALWRDSAESRNLVVKTDYEELGVGMTGGADRQNIWVIFLASSEVKYEATIAASLSDMAAMRQAMLTRVNDERHTNGGLPALVFNELLNQSAQKKADDMFTRDYFAHESPDGVTPFQVITSTGYEARIAAENLAKEPKSVDEVMTGWMNSPGHRANILLNGIEEAGFGLRLGRNASGFHIFWVQHFGKR